MGNYELVINKTFPGEELNPHLQTGTGSFDFLFISSYLAKYKGFGFNTDVVYKINTKNKNDFLFANRLNVTSSFFYSKKIKSLTLLPSVGGYLEQAKMDLDHHNPVMDSGGNVLFTIFGLDIYYKNVSVNVNYQIATIEHLNGEQHNQNRIILGLNYAFN